MPALSRKSLTHSLSMKWKSVRGKNIEVGIDYEAPPVPSHTLDYEKTPVEAMVVVSDTSSEEDSDSSYSDEDATEKYGYGEASPDTENCNKAFPKRLSSRISILRRNSQKRRSSVSVSISISGEHKGTNDNDNDNDNNNVPFHPQRIPRRSSIKGSCPQRAARRRASIGTCTPTNNHGVTSDDYTSCQKRRTSITFNEDVDILKIQALSKVKGAVKTELWFQDNEYKNIRKKTQALLEKVDSNGIVDGKKYCTRGLEKYMECPQKRASKKYEGWDSVLTEQQLQRELNIFDDESIGRTYKHTSTISVVEATNRATSDAKEVASFYN